MDNTKIFNVANYIIKLASKNKLGEEDWETDGITHLKLQKILYFAQAYGLVKDQELFKNDFQAWKYGPVSEDIYRKYKRFKNNSLEINKSFDENSLGDEEKDILNKIWTSFGKFSAGKLVEMSHVKPWENAYGLGDDTIIKKEDIKKYYKPLFA